MAKDCKDIILNREGTSQIQRFLKTLDPENLKLHDFTKEDWVLFAYKFASHVKFFELTNFKNTTLDWVPLFNVLKLNTDLPFRGSTEYKNLTKKVSELLEEATESHALELHHTLFISFLELLDLAKNRFNGITKRHLDFYYKRILQIEKRAPIADKAHIIVELAKRIEEYKVEEGAALDAGKDGNGAKRIFETSNEIVVNRASVDSLRAVYNDTDQEEIKAAYQANSYDGEGEEFPDDNAFWYPFGYTSSQNSLPELKPARLGFAIASPMLALKEGLRNIEISLEFASGVTLSNEIASAIVPFVDVYYSSEKEWVGPISLSDSQFFIVNSQQAQMKRTEMGSNMLNLVFQLERDADPLSAYDPDIHDGGYRTDYPIVRFELKTGQKKGYELFRNLVHRELENVHIEVSVLEVKSLALENDSGVLNPEKPFYPFTTQPLKRSNFYIDYDEAFSKQWQYMSANILWKNTPDSFFDYYFAYREEKAARNSRSIYFNSIFEEQSKTFPLAENQPINPKDIIKKTLDKTDPIYSIIKNPNNLMVPTEDHFKADTLLMNKETWQLQQDNISLFEKEQGVHRAFIEIKNPHGGVNYNIGKSGPIKLSTNQSFLHQQFPRIYALALASDDPNTLIPNSPYTPFIEEISLNYTARETGKIGLNTEKEYLENRVKLFHIGPFGQQQEHGYLKQQSIEANVLSDTAESKKTWLLPDHCHGGEFYIGLKDAVAQQNVSLLFQILEGSENPEADTFIGEQAVEWSVLCNNHWKDLSKEVITNEIDNFLKSGIFSFGIPVQATSENTILSDGLIWLKAKIHKDYDAVCKVIDIHAQAVLSEFTDKSNELSHLVSGLEPGSISKLITRVPQVKSISQPFSSFGGSALEEDNAYYRRVSERLRHKNRAITMWDHEHIVLQEFPEIYKVLCLKHTNADSYLSPGNVTLVVIPDIVNKNVFDIYQPRVSTATLNKIISHVNALTSMHVNTRVINPDYEEVQVQLKVKFRKGLDQEYYKKQMIQDITKFLSPWAFDSTKSIVFGIDLHSSVLIDYLEELTYVDYLQEVSLHKNGESAGKVVSPSHPGAIIVSAKTHLVSTQPDSCTIDLTEPAETCQY